MGNNRPSKRKRSKAKRRHKVIMAIVDANLAQPLSEVPSTPREMRQPVLSAKSKTHLQTAQVRNYDNTRAVLGKSQRTRKGTLQLTRTGGAKRFSSK